MAGALACLCSVLCTVSRGFHQDLEDVKSIHHGARFSGFGILGLGILGLGLSGVGVGCSALGSILNLRRDP